MSKERLVELLKHKYDHFCDQCGINKQSDYIENLADYLLANGVIVPPCKVGDTVWFETFKNNATVCLGVQPHIVERIDVVAVCDTKNVVETQIYEHEIGKIVFLTREEAEAKLKEGNNEV